MLQEAFATITELTNELVEKFGVQPVEQDEYVALFELVNKIYNAGYVDGREYEKSSK